MIPGDITHKSTISEPHSTLHLPNICFADELFTVEECKTIINYSSEWRNLEGTILVHKKEGMVQEEGEYRKCTIYRPPENLEQIKWISDKLLSIINELNNKYYRFDIKGLMEWPNLMKYKANKKGHYDYHLDIGQQKPSCWRKLSYTLFLNDDYEGGALEFKSSSTTMTYSGPVGRLIIFPSYLLHRVNVVTSGIRWAMVGWAHGDSFR